MNIPANLQRRPFLAPIGLLAFTAVAALAGVVVLVGAAWWLTSAAPTTVIVVRHAPQMLGGGSDDPALSPEGAARAAALLRALGGSRLSQIYVTADRRSRETAAGLAERLRITPRILPQDDAGSVARHLLHEDAGQTVLVIAHAGTAPALVAALTGSKDLPPMAAEDYATMYVVTVPRVGRSDLLRLQY